MVQGVQYSIKDKAKEKKREDENLESQERKTKRRRKCNFKNTIYLFIYI